ncbi:MAG: murein L,D-transpeptidase catalytic domain family protein [Vicingaceae bacterium]
MNRYKVFIYFSFAILLWGFKSPENKNSSVFIESSKVSIYDDLKGAKKPDLHLFEKALLGYIDLKLSGYIEEDNQILSLVDFRLPSSEKRFWVIDLESRTILFHTYVAHGENSGDKYALNFSNRINSHQSSLGYYVTRETYYGKNGLSLRLEGLEHGFNHHARKRFIVLHGADYATEEYLQNNGGLGHSEGCPAVPMGEHHNIIEVTKGGSCLFIFFPDLKYTENSRFFVNSM